MQGFNVALGLPFYSSNR